MDSLVKIIGTTNLYVGRIAAPISLVITGLVMMEVILRYFFNAPTTWATEVDQYLLCAMVMLGGGFTLRNYGHTRVDILHTRFSLRTRAWIEVLTCLFILMLTAPMLWFGSLLAYEAFAVGQTSVSAAELPLWPSMASVPLGAFFLLIQGIANGIEAFLFLTTGRPMGHAGGH